MAALRDSVGRFIVLEGPDGSGTTTHAALLASSLEREGHRVIATAEPTNGPIGSTIRTMLTSGENLSADALQLLFTADRAVHVRSQVTPSMQQGVTVICDRYIPSTIAYGEALGLDAQWLADMNTKFVQPDVEILLLPPIEVCLSRLRTRTSTDALEREELQRKVHAAYTRYAAEHPKTIVIDSSPSQESVAEMILRSVRVAL